jgi:hypothetical protein
MLEGERSEGKKWFCIVCVPVYRCVCVCVFVIRQWHLFFYSGNHINEIALLCMRASVKQFDTQHLKWCDLVDVFVVLIWHTTLERVQFGRFISCLKFMRASVASTRTNWHTTFELVQFGQLICCLKFYEGERGEAKKMWLTYNTLNSPCVPGLLLTQPCLGRMS